MAHMSSDRRCELTVTGPLARSAIEAIRAAVRRRRDANRETAPC